MNYSSSTSPITSDITALERGAEGLRQARTDMSSKIDAAKTKVDAVTWTGNWADEARKRLAAVCKDLDIRERQMRVLSFGLSTHAQWLAEEQVRLAKVREEVLAELERRKKAGEVVRALPDEPGWVWDEIAKADGVVKAPRPDSNYVLSGRSMRPRG